MPQLEFKAAENFELSEMDKDRRTAVIAHSVYDNIDRAGDIARRGMFVKSWKENKGGIRFLIDHDSAKVPGTVVDVFDDEKKAYTKVKFGTHTLGNDTLLMMDEGIIKGASFGFYTIKANKIEIKGKKARELKEVLHDETTVTLALPPINMAAGVVSVTKADIGLLKQFKAHIERLEHFCRNTTASDETIQALEAEVKAAQNILSSYDTANTQQITEPIASDDDNSFRNKLLLLNTQLAAQS